jgi:uncharacterized membrane protein
VSLQVSAPLGQYDDSFYPQPTHGPSLPHIKPHTPGMPSRIVQHAGRSRVILSVNIEKLSAESQKANVLVELIPVVGDFVGKDEPLFALYGNASGIDENILRSSISFGRERADMAPLGPGLSRVKSGQSRPLQRRGKSL